MAAALREEVRALIDIDSWAWYKPLSPDAPPGSEPERRELLDCIEADPIGRCQVHASNQRGIAECRSEDVYAGPTPHFVPRFVNMTQAGLSDMGLLDTGDCIQSTLSKRLRKNAEVHNDGFKLLVNIIYLSRKNERVDQKNMKYWTIKES